MSKVPDNIIGFIGRHHVMTLSTVRDGLPWCSNIFYAYCRKDNIFVFTTDPGTRHGSEALENGNVAAAIVLETRVVGKVQGLQIEGKCFMAEGNRLSSAKKTYLARFPYAAAAKLDIWILVPSSFKLTDNTLGFGKKLYWQSEE